MENKYRIRSMLLSEQLLEINGTVHTFQENRWKKELLASFRQKYKINDCEEDSKRESDGD